MMRIEFSKIAIEGLKKLHKSEPKAYKKAIGLIKEIQVHPTQGTGKPEQLKGRSNEWSRRITQKHRLTYRIENEKLLILILATYGHYVEK